MDLSDFTRDHEEAQAPALDRGGGRFFSGAYGSAIRASDMRESVETEGDGPQFTGTTKWAGRDSHARILGGFV